MVSQLLGHGKRPALLLLLANLALSTGCAGTSAPPTVVGYTNSATSTDRVQIARAEVIARFPHDRAAFTQGLLIHRGQLYETTGMEGRSELRRVNLANGAVEARTPYPRREFGEGLAVWNEELVGLTWTNGTAHRWRVADFGEIGTFSYEGEGWGLTSDGMHLIQSNGSDVLTVRDPLSFAPLREIKVTVNGRRLDRLNELEFVNGRIWANVWMTPWIAVIDPASGRVTHMIDLTPLVREVGEDDLDAVANGIAWDKDNQRLYVTGKLWPTLFEIRLPALQN